MGFEVAAGAYDAFMGRYSTPLAVEFANLVPLTAGDTALDVGCGPGALTGELVKRLGPIAIAGVDPSESFVTAARERWPGVDVRQATAESLPFADAAFDHCLAQLVVHFLPDPVAGLTEMVRVTKPGGTVAACVWDFAGGRSPLSVFWEAARQLDPSAPDESNRAGAREGQLADLFARAGLVDITSSTLTVHMECASFDDWWEPFRFGVGPAGEYLAALDQGQTEDLRRRCQDILPIGPFSVEAVAWAAVGLAPQESIE